jgi:phage shock protein PspC (stress-responsive transcriptional regulator)
MEATSRPQRRLERRSDDKMIAGVASGVAAHFGWDPSLVRLGFLGSLFLGGAGLVVYLVAAVILPVEGEPDPPGWRERLRSLPTWMVVTGAALLALIVLSAGNWTDHPGPVIALGLFGVGALLLHESSPRRARFTPPPEREETARLLPSTHSDAKTQVIKKRREPSSLGLFTVATSLLMMAAAWGADRLDIVDMEPGRYFALTLLIFGGGLIVGAFVGRGRALIPMGLLLLPVVLVAGLINVPLRGYFGERNYARGGTLRGTQSLEMLAGDTTLDLSQAAHSDNGHIHMTMAVGRYTVLVPDDWRVYLDIRVQAGRVQTGSRSEDGVDLDVVGPIGPADADETLGLEVDAGAGEIVIQRVPGKDATPPTKTHGSESGKGTK